MVKRLRLLLPLTAVVAVAAGCGSSGSSYTVVADTTITTASFPAQQLIPRINRICREEWPEILENFAKYSRWHEDEGAARKRFAESARLSLMAGIDFHIFDQIHRLGAPKGHEQEIEEAIGSMQSAVERAQKGLEPVSSVAEVDALFAEYNARARELGLDECLVDTARLHTLEELPAF